MLRCCQWAAQNLQLIRRITYGRQLGAHRHRRNRPCTYQSYRSCQLWSSSPARHWAKLAVSMKYVCVYVRMTLNRSRTGSRNAGAERTHPLSMTNAATSSVYAFESARCPEGRRRRPPAPDGDVEGGSRQQQNFITLTLHIGGGHGVLGGCCRVVRLSVGLTKCR